MITFREADHTYWDGERRVPSVSEVLKAAGLGPDYSAIDPDVLARAAARGVHVEQCCQLWSEGVLDETSVHEEARPYLKAFQNFARVHSPRMDKWTWQQPYARDGIAGMPDLLNHEGNLIDVKCTSKIDRSYRIQLAAYRWLLHEPKRKRFVLHLRRDGSYVFKDCDGWEQAEDADDNAVWGAAVALYRWKHHGNGRK